MTRTDDLRERFSEDHNGCWIWLERIDKDGYGRMSGGRLAHRVVFESTRGPIGKGLELDHLCRVRACVNPDHLEPVTHAENMRRTWATDSQGGSGEGCEHPLTKENTWRRRSGNYGCLTCRRERNRAAVARYTKRKREDLKA